MGLEGSVDTDLPRLKFDESCPNPAPSIELITGLDALVLKY